MTTLRLVRRALALPPGEALRKARRLAGMRAAELRQRVRDALAGDPLLIAGPAGAAQGAEPERPDELFRGEAVLPLAWPAAPGWAPAVTPELVERIRFAARRALEHRFDLLGSGPERVDYLLAAPGLEGHAYRMAPGEAAAA